MLVLQRLKTVPTWIEFSPDGQTVIASGFQGETGTGLWVLPGDRYPRHRFASVPEAHFAPDGGSLVIREWDARSDAKSAIYRVDALTFERIGGSVSSEKRCYADELQIAPDGSRVVAIQHRRKLLWWSWPDLDPLSPWSAPRSSTSDLAALAFAPDAKFLALFDTYAGVHLNDTQSGDLVWTASIPSTDSAGKLAYSPDGRFIAAASGTLLRVFDATTGKVVQHLTQAGKYFLGLAFTPDMRFLATVSREETVKFFDTTSWRLHTELAWQVGGLRSIAFSKNGMLSAAGGYGKKIVVWDLDL
jgi:WD40 repeat protein